MKMEQTECPETLAYKIQTLEMTQKKAYKYIINYWVKEFKEDTSLQKGT